MTYEGRSINNAIVVTKITNNNFFLLNTFKTLSFNKCTQFQPIYPSFLKCIHTMCFGNGIHVLINSRAQTILWSTSSSKQVHFQKNEKCHRKASRVNREDGTRHKPFLFTKIISHSGIYVLGRCHEEKECCEF